MIKDIKGELKGELNNQKTTKKCRKAHKEHLIKVLKNR